ncbi:MAG: PQQ-binding-like beta-propeller repeat protein, partial [Crocinitomicaceae bacterium]|nr:PQQ-binding-like beta-propeller repeat protein [Crocinitomicaceae bacterium]
TFITVGYDDEFIKNAMGGKMMNLTVTATGGNNWKSSFEGKVVAHLCANLVGEDVVLNVFTAQGKVFVVHEGITVLDLKSGKVLWTTTFDYTDTDIGLKAKQEIGRTAWPAVAADGVYICDLTKGEKSIKKLDLNTGAVIWTGAKLSKNDIISAIAVEGGNLIVKYGGQIMKETYFGGSENVPETWRVFYEYEGSTSIKAFDTGTGAEKWSTEKWDNGDNFKKAQCNILTENGKVFICSDKFFYSVDATSGKVEIKSEYGAKETGPAQYLYVFDGHYMIEGEKGLAALTLDGKPMYAVNTGKCLLTEVKGDAFIVWIGKSDDDRKEFIRMDPSTGKIFGMLEGCYRPRWDTTGNTFVRFDGSKVLKYKTN